MMRHYWGFPRHLAYRLPTEFNGGRRLPIDVQADEQAYLITAEVPGMSVEDLQVEVLDDLVTLRGEYKDEVAGERLISEIERSGGFYRRIQLPEAIDADAVEAKVENGLLTVRIPKAEEARAKKIEVKAK
ncbi:MAG: Hsp20/alpha crystallin family protein [Chloroflexota bacterium]